MNYKKLDITNWPRKAHFDFFKDFEEPFFGVTFDVEVTKLYYEAKEHKMSFFTCYLYAALAAANKIEAFKYRIRSANEVAIYDVVNASPTINRPDGTFGFSYIDYHDDFEVFFKEAQMEIERVQNELSLVPSQDSNNTIFFSAIPWIKFTSLSHARKVQKYDSVPRISFGKVYKVGDQLLMPISVHVNHALMDGYHVGLFNKYFQNLLNSNLFENLKTNNEV